MTHVVHFITFEISTSLDSHSKADSSDLFDRTFHSKVICVLSKYIKECAKTINSINYDCWCMLRQYVGHVIIM